MINKTLGPDTKMGYIKEEFYGGLFKNG